MNAHHERLIIAARTLSNHLWPEAIRAGGSCLLSCAALLKVTMRAGLRLLPQAGTMQWKMVPPEEDDGVAHNAFAFEWEPGHPLSVAALAAGRLPEMHVWLADVERKEIIDPTTNELPALAAKMGRPWHPRMLPPSYLWCSIDDMPPSAFYRPNLDACALACERMVAIFRDLSL